MLKKISHFYVNKYIVSPFSTNKYYLSYCFKHKGLWFRNYKVASRTIDHVLRSVEGDQNYIYSSEVGYIPARYKDYFKFAFVRHPEEKFISAWKNLVLQRNYFQFPAAVHKQMKDIKNFAVWALDLDKETCDEHMRAQYSLIDLDNIDFIGHIENFDEDFKFVAENMDFDYEYPKKRNVSTIEVNNIPMKVKEMIREMYEQDFELFYPEKINEI